MLNNLSVQKKLYSGFFAIVAIIIVLLALAYNNFTRLAEANGWDQHTMKVLLASAQIDQDVTNQQASHLAFLANGSEAAAAEVKQFQGELSKTLREAKRMTADNPSQQARLGQVENDVRQWQVAQIQARMQKRRDFNNQRITAEQYLRDPLINAEFSRVAALRKVIDDFRAEETRLLSERIVQSNRLRDNMTWILVLGGMLCVGLATGIAYALSRSILLPLHDLTSTVSAIAAGDQSARATVLGNDELGRVTREFNRMAQTVQTN